MRTEKEIRKELAEVESDKRLFYPAATTDENAPLALVQVTLETKVNILKWVLNDKKELQNGIRTN